MQTIWKVGISERDYDYLVDGLGKLLDAYEVDRTSTKELNFKRQMQILQKKLERKKNKLKP